MSPPDRFRLGLWLCVPALAGCAAVTSADGRRMGLASPELRAYVEAVFRDQNAAASDLAFAIEEHGSSAPDADPAAARDLDMAEEALLGACAGLNELATARRDGERLGLRRSAALAREAPDCDRATRAARAVLAGVGN